MRKLIDKQRELMEKSIKLQKITFFAKNADEAEKLRKEQDDAYKKWLFYKKFNSEVSKLENADRESGD